MIKKLILVIGVITLSIFCIKFQFDKVQLTKQLNKSNETIENFKITILNYQKLIIEITNKVSRECPEILRGPLHPPLFKAPSSDSNIIELPDIDTNDSGIITPDDQQYKINGSMPII